MYDEDGGGGGRGGFNGLLLSPVDTAHAEIKSAPIPPPHTHTLPMRTGSHKRVSLVSMEWVKI